MELSEQSQKSESQASPVWLKMCRYSIYLTILGATLSIVRYRTAVNMTKLNADKTQYSDQVGGLTEYLDTYLNTFYYLCGFTLLGLTSFIISLIMLRREKI
jgi:hypothetical protein